MYERAYPTFHLVYSILKSDFFAQKRTYVKMLKLLGVRTKGKKAEVVPVLN
jgi:hypothetical protein